MNRKNEFSPELVEELAELEHNQWLHYSKVVYQQIIQATSLEALQQDLWNKWAPNWKPYSMLSDEEKEKDRAWACKVLETIGNVRR